MRLTLRTLLAYLDDTLEPSQAKLIGQKVAESDAAQELMARIKQVTRRRRLTTPPAGPGAKTDPNMIAEYLDNTLPSEQLAEIEEICLASDVHLAEIAACHQILALVLGEPALVPPTARQRMYGLVKGPEAIPFRKPAGAAENGHETAPDEGPETDETLRLGLPAYRAKGAWTQRLALAAGALALVALLVVAIIQVLPPADRNQVAVENPNDSGSKEDPKTDPGKDRDGKARAADKERQDDKAVEKSTSKKSRKPKKERTPKRGKDKKTRPIPERDKNVAGDKGRRDKSDSKLENGTTAPDRPIRVAEPHEVARYVPPPPRAAPAILVRLPQDEDQWQRLEGRKLAISTGDTLVSLPGYRSEVQFKNGLTLTLWGDLRELSLFSPLLESVVRLHDPGDSDLDLTLDRGRIILVNSKKQEARVRLRFDNPITTDGSDFWDITLQGKGTRIAVDVWGRYPAGVPFSLNKKTRLGPESELYLFLLQGQASVKIDHTTQAMEQAPSYIQWRSKTGQATPTMKLPGKPPWDIEGYPPLPADLNKQARDYLEGVRDAMLKGLKKLNREMSGKKVEAGLIEALKSQDPVQRVLAVRCLGAINDLSDLLDGLVDERPEVRQAAIEDLRHWIALHWDNDLKLHEVLVKEKNYTRGQATTIMELLHSYSDRARGQPETYARLIDYLRQNKPAIRILAHWHLVRLVPGGDRIKYDPMGDQDQLDKAYDAWKEMVPEGSLPKVPKEKPPKK